MVLAILAFICSVVASFGDETRAAFGRWLVNIINSAGYAKIPSSDIFDPAAANQTAHEIRTALDAINADGKRGGWSPALELLTEKRKQAEPLLALPETVSVTILMGMPGKWTPITSFAAQQRISDIKEQYHTAGQPDFLYRTALIEAVRQLKDADTKSGYLGSGCLQKVFELRSNPDNELGEKVREKAVLMYMQQVPEYRKFLGRDKNDYFTLPEGNTYEKFAASMLKNAYGKFPGLN